MGGRPVDKLYGEATKLRLERGLGLEKKGGAEVTGRLVRAERP